MYGVLKQLHRGKTHNVHLLRIQHLLVRVVLHGDVDILHWFFEGHFGDKDSVHLPFLLHLIASFVSLALNFFFRSLCLCARTKIVGYVIYYIIRWC